jgi:hypothetical protein
MALTRTVSDYKDSVKAATVGANINLAAAPNTLDGITLAVGDRILVKDQSPNTLNGIYRVTTLGTGSNGTWTRTGDFNDWRTITSGALTFVEQGAISGNIFYYIPGGEPNVTVGSTAITFANLYTLIDTTAPLQSVTNYGNTTTNGITISNAVQSGSSTSGALIVTGGAGIGGNLYVGGNLVVTGNITTTNYETINQTEYANSIIASGNVTAGGFKWTNGNVYGGYFTVSEINAANAVANLVSNVTTLRFDSATGFKVYDWGNNTAKIALGSSFATWYVAGQGNLKAVGEDTAQFIAGSGISITTNNTATPQSITFSSTYSNSNVASYLPTYTGTLSPSSLTTNSGGQLIGYHTGAIGANGGNTGAFTTITAGTIGNSGATLTGTLSTAAQTNITSVGTLTGLTSTGTVAAPTVIGGTIGNAGAVFYGTLNSQSASQTNITSVGTLTGLTTSGNITAQTANVYAANVIGNTAIYGAAFYFANGTPFTSSSYGNTQVAAYLPTYTGNIGSGNISTGALYINSAVGNYNVLNISGAALAPYGTPQTWKFFTNNTALGGSPSFIVFPDNSTQTTAYPGTSTALSLSGTISASTLNAGTIGNNGATLTGTLSTAAQTNITSVGTLTGLTSSGNINTSASLVANNVYANSVYPNTVTAGNTIIDINSVRLQNTILTSVYNTFSSYSTNLSSSGVIVSFPTITLDSSVGYCMEFFIKFSSLSGTSTSYFNNVTSTQVSIDFSTTGITINSHGYTTNTTNFTLTNGVWYHIALIGTGSIAYWAVNGVVKSTGFGGGFNADVLTNTLDIYKFYGAATYSNFRIVTGSPVYSTLGFAPPGAALTAISGTQLLTLQNSTFVDNSGTSTTISTTGSPTLSSDTVGAAITSPTSVGSIVNGVGTFANIIVAGTSRAASFTATSGGQLTGYLTGAIGANSANSGSFTTLTASGTTNLQGTTNGATINATNLYATTIGNTAAAINGNLINGSAIYAGTIGNTGTSLVGTLSTAAQTNITSTGALTSPSFTTNSGGQLTGYHTGAIGANTANTGNFTTVSLTNTANSYGAGQGALQIAGGFYAGGDSWINGNLYVANIASINYTALSVNSPMVYLDATGLTNYNYEIGIYSHKYDAIQGYNHTGMVRNHLDNAWYFFSNIRTEPTATVDLANAYMIYDTVKMGNAIVYGNIVGGYFTGAIGANGANSGAFTTVTTTGNLYSGGNIIAASGTTSTSTTTGALVVNGGAGISGALYTGGNLVILGNSYIGPVPTTFNYSAAPLNLTNSLAGALKTQLNLINTGGGAGAGSAIDFYTYTSVAGGSNPETRISTTDDGNYSGYIGFWTKTPGNSGANSLVERLRVDSAGNVVVFQTTTSTSTTTGALVVNGGVGVAGALYANNFNGVSLYAGTIGNTGATLTGTLSTAAQTNITSVGTLGSLTVSGTTNLQGTTNGATINATTIQSGTIGNSGAIFTGATQTLTSTSQAASFTTSGGGQLTGYHTGAIGANGANSGAFTTLTASGNIALNNYANIYIATGSASQTSALTIVGNVYGQGGAGYLDFLKLQNTYSAVTNPNKYFRIDQSGAIQIINSAYTNNIFNLTDAGALTVPSVATVGNLVTTNGVYWPNGSVYSSGGSGSPGGSSTQIQFNSGGTFGGATYLQYASGSGNLVSSSATASTSQTTGAIVVSGGIGVGGAVYADTFRALNNGNGTNYYIGDDAVLGDINSANTTRLMGQQDGTQGYIVFGNSNATNYIGRSGTNPLTVTGAFNVTGTLTGVGQIVGYFNGAIGANTANTGAFTTVVTTGNTYSGGNVIAASGTTSTTTTTGAVVISGSGGIGVGGNVNAGGYLTANGYYNESTTTPGVYIGNAGTAPYSPRVGFFNGNASANWQIDNYNGAFRWYTPGVTRMTLDALGNLSLYNYVSISGTGAATSATTGALTVGGGVGIAGNLYVGGNLSIAGNTTFINTQTITTTDTISAPVINANVVGNTGSSHYGTIATNAQPFITSVGTLSALTVSGITNLQGNTNAVTINAANVYATTVGNVNTNGNITALSGTLASTVNNSIYFNGSNSSVSGTVAAVNGNFTMEAWVYPTVLSNSTNPGVVSIMNGTGTNTGFWLYVTTTGWFVRNLAGNLISYSTTPSANVWYHVALVRNGSTTSLYINGVSVASTASALTLTDTTFIAGDFNTAGGHNYFTGYITGIRYVNGTAVYTANFTPSYASPTSIANTALLLDVTSSAAYLTDGSSAAVTVTATGLPTFSTLTYANTFVTTAFITSPFLYANSNTGSTSTTTGTMVITGGAGISGNLYVGNIVTTSGIFYPNGATAGGGGGSSTAAGANTSIQFANGTAFGGATYLQYNYISGNLVSNSATTSTSTTTGALVVGGGVGISGNLYVGGNLSIAGNTTFINTTTISTTDTIAAPTINANVVGNTGSTHYGTIGTNAQPYITSVGTLTGLTTTGNATIGSNSWIIANNFTTTAGTNGNIFLDPDGSGDVVLSAATTLYLLDTSATNSTTSGTLISSGGAGIAGNVYVGGNIYTQQRTGYTYSGNSTSVAYTYYNSTTNSLDTVFG